MKKYYGIGIVVILIIIAIAASVKFYLAKKGEFPSLKEQSQANSGKEELPLDAMKTFILDKTKKNGEKFKNRLPVSTVKGKFTFSDNGGWVGGFWPGANYLCYELSGDKFYLDEAKSSEFRFKNRIDNYKSLDHDVGFLYSLTSVADYKLTGNKEAKDLALRAADTLIGRFNEKGKFIKAWNESKPTDINRGRMIVDTMYNLPLLFWASEETGDAKYKNIAVAHADTCLKYIVREDYSTYHTYIFDPDTGEPKKGMTHQGYADESCWSRGQAWAIGGYTYAYEYTGDKRYLEAAEGLAKYFINSLEEDYVPMWDFRLTNKSGEPRDSSAGAIAAASMLELAENVKAEDKNYYRDNAKNIIKNLYEKYSSKDMPEQEGLLLHGVGNKPGNKEIDCSLIYGDYYFTEAVAKLLGKDKRYWNWK